LLTTGGFRDLDPTCRKIGAMKEIALNENEIAALITVLESTLSDLSYEIADTDRKKYRDEIKAQRDVLAKILDDLKKASG
jgi:hypothetical protein